MKRPRRKYRPVSVERDAALIALGLDPKDVHYDHQPPLAMREYNPETGEYSPVENDPHHLVPLSTKAHKEKTSGPKAKATVADTDIHKIAKMKRLRALMALRDADIDTSDIPEVTEFNKFKRKMPSRPFPKRKKKHES